VELAETAEPEPTVAPAEMVEPGEPSSVTVVMAATVATVV